MSYLEQLRKLYRQRRLIPFLGAGVSMSVEWTDPTTGSPMRGPSWNELVSKAAEMLGFDPQLLWIRGEALQILEYFRLKKGDISPLMNWLSCAMNPPDQALKDSPIHEALAALTKCRLIYTTNYDNFIERSFALHNRRSHVIAKELHITDVPEDECCIVKFHGDFSYPDTMVVTESDYYRRVSFTSTMDFRFRSDVLGKALLFLGYGFRDSNVAYLFHLVNDVLKDLPVSSYGRRAYIAVPEPSDFETTLFRQRNIDVVPISQRDMTGEVAQLLTDIGT